uniref:Uncharacterized protein n=1 Tax=Pararge aegeria TaxID=116150 RepID=S4PAK7_9NEOP
MTSLKKNTQCYRVSVDGTECYQRTDVFTMHTSRDTSKDLWKTAYKRFIGVCSSSNLLSLLIFSLFCHLYIIHLYKDLTKNSYPVPSVLK